jgi:hypothetical protein
MHMTRQIIAATFVFACVLLLSYSVADAQKPGKTDSSAQAFKQMTQVLRHPRCMNCHSKGDFPRQGDDSHQHTMNVRRGPAGLGVTAQKCSTCHQDHNLGQAHLPPGAPSWHLPSPQMPMIWEGLSDAQLCASLKDPAQNNHRNLREIQEHFTQDKLVAWGWDPGIGREPVPIAKPQFNALVKQWVDGGGACPQ